MRALNGGGFAGNAVIVHGGAMAIGYRNRGNAHGPVNTWRYNNPAGGNYCIMCAVVVTHGAVNTPCQWMPGAVPNGVRAPGKGRYPYCIGRRIYKTNTRPCPNVHYNTVGGERSSAFHVGTAGQARIAFVKGIAAFFGFYNGFFAINIFITNDIDHGIVVTAFFQLYHGNILAFGFRYQRLQYKYLNIAIAFAYYSYIISVTIFVKIEVVYLAVFRIEPFFKILGGA